MTLSIPNNDAAEFSGLKDEVRADIQRKMRAIGPLLDVKKGGIGKAIAAAAAQLGLSTQQTRRYYDAYRQSGSDRFSRDWRAFKNKAKSPDTCEKLPEEFVAFVLMLCEKNQRKCAPAFRQIKRFVQKRSLTVDGITYTVPPGYEAWPEINGTGLPHGWGERNLYRLLESQEKKAQLTAMRQGLGSAIALHIPKILTTRFGLWVGSHISFDDVLRDVELLSIGKNQIVRPQELGAMDFFSADRFLVQRRPQYKDGDRMDNVKECEMRCLVASWLRNIGYSIRGSILLVELGTATIRAALEEFLYEHSDGLITLRRAGITGKEQALKGYFGRGGGNPHHKGLQESHHNLLHNESGNLPAPTGHDRNPPEWLFGLQAVTQGVCKDLAKLSPERAELLASPHLEYWQGLDLLKYIDHLIAYRTDHRIEGWEKCGHTAVEYRLDPEVDEWLSLNQFLALPKSQQSLVAAAASADARYRRPRKLAPREVFRKGASELIRFPDHVIALMFADDRLGLDMRQKKSLTPEGEFEISDQLAGPDRMYFHGDVVTPQGEIVSLRQLDERGAFGVVLNPWDAAQLWVYDKNGGFLGTAARKERLSRLEEHSHEMTRALGRREHQIATMVTPLRDRHANAAIELRAINRNNDRVRNGEAVTREEKQSARNVRRMPAGSIDDLVDVPTSQPLNDSTSQTSSDDDLSAEGLL